MTDRSLEGLVAGAVGRHLGDAVRDQQPGGGGKARVEAQLRGIYLGGVDDDSAVRYCGTG
jgi:hypothetical protein